MSIFCLRSAGGKGRLVLELPIAKLACSGVGCVERILGLQGKNIQLVGRCKVPRHISGPMTPCINCSGALCVRALLLVGCPLKGLLIVRLAHGRVLCLYVKFLHTFPEQHFLIECHTEEPLVVRESVSGCNALISDSSKRHLQFSIRFSRPIMRSSTPMDSGISGPGTTPKYSGHRLQV